MNKIYSLFLIVLINFTACCPTGDCHSKQQYIGFSECDFSSIIKDKNQTLYVVANRYDNITKINTKREKLYRLNQNNFIRTEKKIQDISFKYILEINTSNLPSTNKVIDLLNDNKKIDYSKYSVQFIKLFDLFQNQAPYQSAIVRKKNTEIGYILLFDTINNNLVLLDKLKYNYLHFNSININGAFYIENTEYDKDKWNNFIYDKLKKREFITYNNGQIITMDLANFVDDYYQNNINFSVINKDIESNLPNKNFNVIRYSIYPEGLHIVFTSKTTIKNEDLKKTRAIAPLPEGVYQSIYRFYPIKNDYFKDITLPIDRNCTKSFY